MENTTEVEYISMDDKLKRGRGRPSGSKYSDEEKRQKSEKRSPVAITITMNTTHYISAVINKQTYQAKQ